MKIELNTSTAKQSSTVGDYARFAFGSGQYSRTGRKKIGEWWEVQFKEEQSVHYVKLQSYNYGSSYGHGRLGKVNVFIGDNLCG